MSSLWLAGVGYQREEGKGREGWHVELPLARWEPECCLYSLLLPLVVLVAVG